LHPLESAAFARRTSAAPIRHFRKQQFGPELGAVVGRHTRTTAITNPFLLDGFGEGQVLLRLVMLPDQVRSLARATSCRLSCSSHLA
jgi:hypothetical protein